VRQDMGTLSDRITVLMTAVNIIPFLCRRVVVECEYFTGSVQTVREFRN
jgi:hypothetical protein